MSKNAYYQVYRKQFPLTPAEAITIHKSQGSTCESACVNLNKPLTRELLYVALSRVTSLSKLYLVGNFHATKPPSKDNETMIEIERLKNEKQLSLSFCSLKIKLGTVVGYHNVVSFVKYRFHIINDEWYSQCDILILVETQTVGSHQPELPGFNLIHRSNKCNQIGTRGILVFAKSHIEIKLVQSTIKYSTLQKSKSFHSEMFVFETPEINLITGYKSPLTPAKQFQDQINDALTEAHSKGCKQNVLMGDFNFDISQKGQFLINILNKHNLISKLNEPTTKNNTIIDVIFADFPNITAGAYESYFSDHKPIFCMIYDYNLAPEKIQNFHNENLKRKFQVDPHSCKKAKNR